MDPISSISGGITACLNASIKIFEITYQLKAVEQQTSDLLSTTRLVDHNVKEARRLRRLKVALLSVSERAWMDGVIDHTENALRAVAQLIEPARVDKTTSQGINFGNKVMWVFRDNPQVRDRHQRLVLCHQSLTTIISCLYSKDVMEIAPMADDDTEEQPPPYDSQIHEFLNWRHRRRGPSSTSPSSIRNTEISQSSPSSPSNPDGLWPQVRVSGEISKSNAAIPQQQISSLTSNLFKLEDQLSEPPASSQEPDTPQWHNEKLDKRYPANEVSNTAPTLDIHLQDKDSIFHWTLPEIDMGSFTGMISDKAFHYGGHHHHHHHHHHHSGIHEAYSTQHDALHRNHQDFKLPATTTPFAVMTSPTTAATSFSTSPQLPPPPPPPSGPSSSSSDSTGIRRNTGQNRACDYLPPRPPARHRYSSQPEAWTKTRAIDQQQPSTSTRFERDDKGSTVQWQYRPDSALRVPPPPPPPASEEDVHPFSAVRASVRRCGRDWLAYQATRSEVEHGMDSDG